MYFISILTFKFFILTGLRMLMNYIPPIDDVTFNDDTDNGPHGWKNMAAYIQKRQVLESNMTKKQKNKLKKLKLNSFGCNVLKSISIAGCYNIKSKGKT